MLVSPRFIPRNLFRQYKKTKNINKKNIQEHLKIISNKNIILDYSQARIALFHLLKNSIPSNSFVLTSSYTIYDMVNVIISAGHKPYFIDIDKDHLGPNINQIESVVKNKIVNCIIITHLHGYNIDLENLSKLCKLYNCMLIEDCAQSMWSNKWSKNNISPGYFSDAAIYSTGFYKNINTISGGFLLLNKRGKYTKDVIYSHSKISALITKDFLNRLINAMVFYIAVNKIVFPIFTFPLLRIARKYKIKFINNRAREEVNPTYIKRTSKDFRRMNFIQKYFMGFKDNISLEKDFIKKLQISRIYLDNLINLKKDNFAHIPGTHIINNKLEFFIQTSLNQIPLITNKPIELINYLQDKDFDIALQNLLDLNSLKVYTKYKKEELSVANDISKKVILLPCYPECKHGYITNLVKAINMYFYNK